MKSIFMSMAVLAAALQVATSGTALAAGRDKPNIIVILADDLGWGELGAQGVKTDIPTPHIDSISADGVRFTQGYVSGPYCSPTRAGLLTGRYQTRFGHEFNEGMNAGFGLSLDEQTIADRLKAAGYATAAIGKWHLGVAPQFRPTKRGFDEFYGTLANTPFYHPQLVDSRKSEEPARVEDDEFYTTEAYADRAVEWIESHKDEPFFLYLPFNAQHAPLQAPEKYLARFNHIENPTRKTFAAMLSALDDAVGRVLQTLDKNNLAEDTLVIFLADNGGPTQQTSSSNLPLRGFKATTLEGGVRVPFFARWKGRLPAGKEFDNPVIQLDILPTALAAAGVAVDPGDKLDGVNLLPHLEGKAQGAPHDALYWRFGEQWAVRQGDWKLVASRADAFEPQLFNLANDKEELHNLIAEQPEKAAELKTAWDAWNAGNIPPKWTPQPQQQGGNRQRRQAQGAAAAAGATAVGN